MTTIALSRPTIGFRIKWPTLRGLFARPARDQDEESRERREFILTMMNERSDAFQSEADVQCMLHMYPGRF